MKKITSLAFIFVIPLLTIGAGCAKQNNNETSSADNTTSTFAERNDEIAVRVEIKPGVEIVKTKTGTTTTPTKDYGATLAIYGKSGWRFQFVNCSGSPGYLTMKIGTKFMIDNRDNKSHQISIGTKKYQLGAYDFSIVSIQKAGDYNITCDGGGSARVLVQK